MAEEYDEVQAPPPVPKETDAEKSARRAGELGGALDAHRARVDKAHADYPTPPGVKFTRLSAAEKKRYNDRAAVVAASSREYHRAVRAAAARHRDEDHDVVVQVRGAAAARFLADYRRQKEAAR